jgi:hypothetical protein
MQTPRWQRWAARTVLVTFTTCALACGAPQGETQTTSTLPAAPPPTAMAAPPTQPPPPPPPPPPPSPTLPPNAPEQLSKEELRDLVAPIALYPDVVLGSLLPATTFPEQISEAASYVGEAQTIDRIPDDRGWDGSILGLLQFPDVVRWLDDNPAWTDQMGQAVTYQQGDVLQAIQDYRRLVRDAGNLRTNEYQRVTYVEGKDIRIEPAQPDVVYVPSYDTVLATQPQPVVATPGVNPWIAFGAGAAVGALGAWALYSIFDDDDDVHIVNNYYGGRRIRGYDNYYYQRGRRPRRVDWTPRERAYRRHDRVESTRPLQHKQATPGARRAGGTLRPPTTRAGQRPADARREQREMRQEQKQENRQQKQLQREENRQQKQERQQQQRQQRQDRQDQKRQQRQGQQQQRQERQQQQRQQRQDRRQGQQMQRQERQQQRQENRQQRRQGGGDQNNQNKKKKKQQQQ